MGICCGALVPAVQIELKSPGPLSVRVLFLALMIAWLYSLLRGVRWVWLATVALYVLGLAYELVSGSLLRWGTAISLLLLLCLLLPVTRRHFSKSPAPALVDPR